MKTRNKLLLSPLRGWDSLHAASLCFGCPKARRWLSVEVGSINQFNNMNIFLDFMNPDWRRSLGWYKDYSRNHHLKMLDRGYRASFLLSDEYVVVPPTFILECPFVRTILKRYSLSISEGKIRFPLRESSISDFYEKKLHEYRNVISDYEGLSGNSVVTGMNLIKKFEQARMERRSEIGNSIVDSFISGADVDEYWKSHEKTNVKHVSKILEAMKFLQGDGHAITSTNVISSTKEPVLDVFLDRLVQRYYAQAYLDEYDLVILENFPSYHSSFGHRMENKKYDYAEFLNLTNSLSLQGLFLVSPSVLNSIKRSSSWVRVKNEYFRLIDSAKTAIEFQGRIAEWRSRLAKHTKIDKSTGESEAFEYLEYISSNADSSDRSCLVINNKLEKNKMKIVVFVALGEEERVFNKVLSDVKLESSEYHIISPNQMGRVPAACLVTKYLTQVTEKPDLILVAGIAGGFEKRGIKLGDVIVPNLVFDLASAKTLQEGEEVVKYVRTEPFRLDRRISDYVSSSSFNPHAWGAEAAEIARSKPGWAPEVSTDPISCGDEVVANLEWPKIANQVHDKTTGVDMESGGVCAAAELYNIPVAVIRGVSDHANPAKSDGEWRDKALYAAASLTRHAIQNHEKWQNAKV